MIQTQSSHKLNSLPSNNINMKSLTHIKNLNITEIKEMIESIANARLNTQAIQTEKTPK